MAKKPKLVPPEHRAPHGTLPPWGGAYIEVKTCEIHKLDYVNECPVCADIELD